MSPQSTPRPRSAALALLFAAHLASCSQPTEPEGFGLRPVVAEQVDLLEAALAAAEPAAAEAASDDDLRERIDGLISLLSSTQPDFRSAAREEVAGLGDVATPVLRSLLADPALEASQRIAAAELLAAVPTRLAAEALLRQLETATEPWLRAQCAWRLGQTDADWIVPRVILRLKYEKDWDTVIWMADTLARFGNYAGSLGLLSAVTSAPTEALRSSAFERLRAHGVALELFSAEATESPDVRRVSQRWNSAAAVEISPPPRSDAYQRELWRFVEGLSDFQLRGVDDGRFVLSRLDAFDALSLAEALHDRDAYIRVHVAQSLERMGPRAGLAVPELRAALAEPTLAIYAAEALGGIGPVSDGASEPLLRARLAADQPTALRISCARALGQLGAPACAPALRKCLDPFEPDELRQAAAESLVYVEARTGSADSTGTSGPAGSHVRDALPVLIAALSDVNLDAQTSEDALAWLLDRRVAANVPNASADRKRWNALAPPPELTPTSEENAVRRAGYAAIAGAWQ